MTVLFDSNLETSVLTVRKNAGFMLLDAMGVIEISGEEAAEFLQSQTTNDVLALNPGQGHLNALVDRKAHIQSVFSLHCLEKNIFWLFTDKELVEKTIERLEAFHFTEKVNFLDRTADFAFFALQGPQSKKLLNSDSDRLSREYEILRNHTMFDIPVHIMKRSITGEEGFWFIVLNKDAQNFHEKLQAEVLKTGGVEISVQAQKALRIEAGILKYGLDVNENDLLPETGLQHLTVSYTKGCYVGQEVIARVKTYGTVQKALTGLVFKDINEPPPYNAKLKIKNEEIGELKSTCYSPTLNAVIAYVYLSKSHRTPNQTISLTANDNAYEAKVMLLPFYTPLSNTEEAAQKLETGLKAFAEGDENLAINLLREAIALDPHLADAYEALGVILSRHEQFDEAISLMQKLSSIDSDCIMAHTNLSVFYMKKGMKDEAEEEKAIATTLSFKQALAEKAFPQAPPAVDKRQEFEDKIAMFQEVLGLDPEDSLANYSLGNIFVELGEAEKAVPHLEQALKTDPKYTVAYLALGKAFQALNEADKARLVYENGIAVAAQRGDLMPLKEMEQRIASL